MFLKNKILLMVSLVAFAVSSLASGVVCACEHDNGAVHDGKKHAKQFHMSHMKKGKAHHQCDHGCEHKAKHGNKKSCEMKKKSCCERKIPPAKQKENKKSSLLDHVVPIFSRLDQKQRVYGAEVHSGVPWHAACFYHKNAVLAFHQSFLC